MGYVDTFRNSLVVDILEWTGMVALDPNFKLQVPQVNKSISSSTRGSLDTPPLRAEEDIEKSSKSDEPVNEITDEQPPSDLFEEIDPFLVDWNGEDDPENPSNWSKGKKALISVEIMFYTFVTYMGSSIYTPGQPAIQEEFGIGHVAATLTLSLFILGYSLGPMIFSPISEMSRVGRNHIYMVTLFFFWLFQVGVATTPTFAGLLVLRFITGFFSSPAISTGGATLGDFVSPDILPVFIGLWAVGGFMAPSLAPILGAAMLIAKGWRWVFWLLMWIDAFGWLFMIFFLPETQHQNILHRRANRIRKQTGDDRFYTRQEREDSKIEMKPFLKELLLRPFILIAVEPGILAYDAYLALIYGCYYLFFEAFPIVYTRIYDFGPVFLGLSYIGFAIGCLLGYMIFFTFLMTQVVPRFKNNTFTPETFLYLSIWVCFLLPIALFLFGWAASTHWVVPIVAEVIYAAAAFNIFQSGFAYLSLNYPRYLASVFAGNAFMRSVFAVAFPLFGQAMYDNLSTPKYPVAWGSSLLGFVALGMTLIPFVLFKLGPKLRGRSKYAN